MGMLERTDQILKWNMEDTGTASKTQKEKASSALLRHIICPRDRICPTCSLSTKGQYLEKKYKMSLILIYRRTVMRNYYMASPGMFAL